MILRSICFITILSLFPLSLHAQQDSLWLALDDTKEVVSQCVIYSALFDAYYDQGNDSCLIAAERLYQLSSEISDDNYIIKSLLDFGLYYEVLANEPQRGLEYYQQAYTLASDKNSEKLKDVTYFMGTFFHYLDDYEKAEGYYKQTIELAEVYNDQYRRKATSINLASIYSSQKKYELAERAFMKILDSASVGTEPYLDAMAQSNLGNLYIRQGNFKKAIICLNACVTYFKQADMLTDYLLCLTYIAEASIGQGQSDHLEKVIEELKFNLPGLQDVRTKSLVYSSLSDVYEFLGDYKQALMMKNQHFVYFDSLKQEQREEAIYELEAKYQSELRKNELNELKIKSQQAEINLATQKNKQVILILTSLVFLILIIVFILRSRNASRHALVLQGKNEQIATALSEREILLKEIHHRVKNNLQVISSLLNLQVEELEEEAAAAVRDGQYRVKSMALIHQKLYQENDLIGVRVGDYLESLIDELVDVFFGDSREVDVKVNASFLKLDVDTLIPLGLIINELVTNSLKYAFEGVCQPLLEVKITEVENILHVYVRDNGVGMGSSRLEELNGFGWKMIRSLCRQLKATIAVKQDEGTSVYLQVGRYTLIS